MSAQAWTEKPLAELLTSPVSYGIVQPGSEVADGVPIVRVTDIRNNRISPDSPLRVAPEIAAKHKRTLLEGGELLYSVVGALGECAVVPEELRGWNVARAVSVLRVDPKVGAPWVMYSLQTPWIKDLIESWANTTVQKTLNLRDLAKVPIALPTEEEREDILNLLGALDDKIELNRRMNATLEAMAQAVFKEWFVDGAKEEWEENSLSSLFTISKASVNPGASPETVFDHYSIPAFDDGRLPKQELGDAIKSNKFTVPDGCILISKLNPRFPRVWLPVLDGDRQAITSTEFIVCILKSKELREFVYGLFTSHGFASEFNNMATGSTGSHQRVRPESMLKMATLIADRSTIKAYSTLVRPMLERISANITESRTLAALRDTLLPKLMRGEVKVKGPSQESLLSTNIGLQKM